MLRIQCPFCGERNHTEFAYGGDASQSHPPLDAPAAAWHARVFLRQNVCGRQRETWQHIHGCRMWLLVERDTQTHEIFSVLPADEKLQAFMNAGFHSDGSDGDGDSGDDKKNKGGGDDGEATE